MFFLEFKEHCHYHQLSNLATFCLVILSFILSVQCATFVPVCTLFICTNICVISMCLFVFCTSKSIAVAMLLLSSGVKLGSILFLIVNNFCAGLPSIYMHLRFLPCHCLAPPPILLFASKYFPRIVPPCPQGENLPSRQAPSNKDAFSNRMLPN